MSKYHVIACVIHVINLSHNQSKCDVYPIEKDIQDEIPLYVFSFDS